MRLLDALPVSLRQMIMEAKLPNNDETNKTQNSDRRLMKTDVEILPGTDGDVFVPVTFVL